MDSELITLKALAYSILFNRNCFLSLQRWLDYFRRSNNAIAPPSSGANITLKKIFHLMLLLFIITIIRNLLIDTLPNVRRCAKVKIRIIKRRLSLCQLYLFLLQTVFYLLLKPCLRPVRFPIIFFVNSC